MVFAFGVSATGSTLSGWHISCVEKLVESGLSRFSCAIDFGSHHHSAAQREYEQYARAQSLNAPSSGSLDVLAARYQARLVRAERSSGDLSAIAHEYALDFVIDFSHDARRLDLLPALRQGVWTFVFGDLEAFVSQAIGFWEIYHGRAVTGAALVKLTAQNNAVVLRQGYLRTIHHSLAANIDSLCNVMVEWPALACRDLQINEATDLRAPTLLPSLPQCGFPNRRQRLACRFIVLRARLWRYVHARLFRVDWSIARLRGTASRFIGSNSAAEIERVHPGERGRYLADPFVVARNNKRYVLCEEYSYDTNLGRIVACELSDDGYSALRPAIQAAYHLSYPYTFEYQNELYCLPETLEPRIVQLYQAVEFPYNWRALAAPLVKDFAAVDSTLVQHENKWWLFCTNLDEGYHSHLYVFYADDLFGPWRPHTKNPVKIDVRSAGPAGPFFWHEGGLYRPTQDCSRLYGGCINITRIERLTEDDFCERIVGTIKPPIGKYHEGIHTLSSAGDVWLVDVMRYTYNPGAAWAFATDFAKALLLRLGFSQESLRAIRRRLPI